MGVAARQALKNGPDPSLAAPSRPQGLSGAPPEVRDFLRRVLDALPPLNDPLLEPAFLHWPIEGKVTQESVLAKDVPRIEPDALIARVMDVNGYVGRIGYVEVSQVVDDSAFVLPGERRCLQRVRVPGITKVQHELVLVDAGLIDGYRVAYWYLLENETSALDPAVGARSAFNIGAWFVAPGRVGYAMSSWPRREDLNAFQWFTMTRVADTVARRLLLETLDSMCAWALQPDPIEQAALSP